VIEDWRFEILYHSKAGKLYVCAKNIVLVLISWRLFPEVFETQLRLEFGMIESTRRVPEIREEWLSILVIILIIMMVIILVPFLVIIHLVSDDGCDCQLEHN
jgi:hypothetical protein